jgi:hypothetical protein
MSTISSCPRCSRLVAIPRGLDPTALVRCPMCDSEYPLNEAIVLFPLELIPVATSEEATLIDISQPISETDLQEADIIPIESAEIKSIPIHAGDVSEPSDEAEQESDTTAPPIVPSFLLKYGDTVQDEENSHPNFAADETTETAESPLDDEVFSLIAKHKEETEKESPNPGEPMALQRLGQRKPRNELRFFIGLATSGFLGLSIAYVSMAWFMGSQFPFPSPPKVLKPVLRFVLPDRIWHEKEEPTNKQ